jgi:hypothetical protein
MVIAFWSIVLLVLIGGFVWTRVHRRRVIASIEASGVAPDGTGTAGSQSSYEVESRSHMGRGSFGTNG